MEGRGERWHGRGLEHDKVTSDIGEIKNDNLKQWQPGGRVGQWWMQVREVRSDGKDGRRGEECEERATCYDGEGGGRSMKRTQSTKRVARRGYLQSRKARSHHNEACSRRMGEGGG